MLGFIKLGDYISPPLPVQTDPGDGDKKRQNKPECRLCIIYKDIARYQLFHFCFLQSGMVITLRRLRGSMMYQQMTAHLPSSRDTGFFRGSLTSVSLKDFSCCRGVRMTSVVPSALILVSTSLISSEGSSPQSIKKF